MHRGTGVSRGVRRATWERSLKVWELQIFCFEEFLGGEAALGLVPASLPHTLVYACTFYAPTSPPPNGASHPIGQTSQVAPTTVGKEAVALVYQGCDHNNHLQESDPRAPKIIQKSRKEKVFPVFQP